MNETRVLKNSLRLRYLAERQAIPKEKKAEYDRKICSFLASLASYRFSEILLIYYPKPDEINIRTVILSAIRRGKAVALPRCREEGRMDFRFITSPDELCRGVFGIMEPPESAPVFTPGDAPAVCVVPAVLFDIDGYRIGYGKGYYDRYLAGFRGIKIGITYSDFLIDRVPRGRYDLPVDVLITEKGIRTAGVNL